MPSCRRIAWCLLCVVASGCVGSTFVLTDSRYAGRPRTNPAVYIDRLPPFPYYSIGVIEVTGPAGLNLAQVLAEAASKGADVGCDVVVDRSIHRIASLIPGAGPLLAQAYMAPTPVYTPVMPPPPPSKREFICGIGVAPMPMPPAPQRP